MCIRDRLVGHHERRVRPLAAADPGRIRPRHDVADALALAVDDRGDERDPAEGEPELAHPDERTDERLPEPDRSAVVAHDPDPERELAQGTTPSERLDESRDCLLYTSD